MISIILGNLYPVLETGNKINFGNTSIPIKEFLNPILVSYP